MKKLAPRSMRFQLDLFLTGCNGAGSRGAPRGVVTLCRGRLVFHLVLGIILCWTFV